MVVWKLALYAHLEEAEWSARLAYAYRGALPSVSEIVIVINEFNL